MSVQLRNKLGWEWGAGDAHRCYPTGCFAFVVRISKAKSSEPSLYFLGLWWSLAARAPWHGIGRQTLGRRQDFLGAL